MAKNTTAPEASISQGSTGEKTAPDHNKALWESAYSQVHSQNHYFKGEGPSQALNRLKEEGILGDVSIEDISKQAHQKVKTELGSQGTLRRNHYTTRDHVLSQDEERDGAGRLVEKTRKHEEADRLAPSQDNIEKALSSDTAQKLEAAGLHVQAAQLREKMIKRMEEDHGLKSPDMEKMKSFPVGAPYVATGAVSSHQMDSILQEQKAARQQMQKNLEGLKDSNPSEFSKQWSAALKQTEVGHLLRTHAEQEPQKYNLQKIEAADALITKLQEQQKNGH